MKHGSHTQQISKYIKAKDTHKPHLMNQVFTKDAVLQMKVKTDNIAFPSEVSGVSNITETLVRGFHQSYENVYTVCFIDTVTESGNTLNCRWLVVMTDKSSQQLRVGYGDYHWVFGANDSGLVSELTIVIDNMIILPADHQVSLMAWMEGVSYPWADSADVLAAMPELSVLEGIV